MKSLVTKDEMNKELGIDLAEIPQWLKSLNSSLNEQFNEYNELTYIKAGSWVAYCGGHHCIKPWEHISNTYFENTFNFKEEHFYIDIEESVNQYDYTGHFDLGLCVWKFNKHLYSHQLVKYNAEQVNQLHQERSVTDIVKNASLLELQLMSISDGKAEPSGETLQYDLLTGKSEIKQSTVEEPKNTTDEADKESNNNLAELLKEAKHGKDA